MIMRLHWIVALVLLSAGCAHGPDYYCEAMLTNEHGEFRATPDAVEWRFGLGEGMQASLGMPYTLRSADDFRAQGFGPSEESPFLVISFDHRLNRNDWMQQPPRLSVSGEIRIGDRSHNEWVSNLHMTTFSHTEWRALLAESGDMEVLMLEGSERTVLQRSVIPRRALESVEATLQRLATQRVEMERDPAANCMILEEEEGVTIT